MGSPAVDLTRVEDNSPLGGMLLRGLAHLFFLPEHDAMLIPLLDLGNDGVDSDTVR